MTEKSSFGAFPDFHTACLWHALFGRPINEPPVDAGKGRDEPEANETEFFEEGTKDPPNEDEEENEDNSEDTTPFTEGDQDSIFEHDLEETAEPTFDLTEPTESETDPRHRTIIQVGDTTEIIQNFSSWHDFMLCVRDTKQAWVSGGGSRRDGDKNFTGTQTWNEAIRMGMETGWPEGRKLLRDISATVIPQPIITEAWDFDVAGAYPLVPMYCAGDPACMVTEINQEQRAARPIVRIDLHRNVNWTVPIEAIITRGAAMLSFAETLERLGYSTELRIVQAATRGNFIHRSNTVFKKAGEILDLDRAAFAIAHPASYRRLIFALYEQHVELARDFCVGYGMPLREPNDPTSGKPGGAIWIPSPESAHETPETAQIAVELAAKAAGFDNLFSSQLKAA